MFYCKHSKVEWYFNDNQMLLCVAASTISLFLSVKIKPLQTQNRTAKFVRTDTAHEKNIATIQHLQIEFWYEWLGWFSCIGYFIWFACFLPYLCVCVCVPVLSRETKSPISWGYYFNTVSLYLYCLPLKRSSIKIKWIDCMRSCSALRFPKHIVVLPCPFCQLIQWRIVGKPQRK